MKSHRDTLIQAATADSGLRPSFAELLIADAPWLDGTEELSGEIGLELLAEAAAAAGLSAGDVVEFIARYNTLVQGSANPQAIRQSEAYLALSQALRPFGKEGGFGEGDYWLVRDSFSSKTPVVLLYDEFRLPLVAITKLQELLNQYSGVFSELRINTDFGGEILTLRPR